MPNWAGGCILPAIAAKNGATCEGETHDQTQPLEKAARKSHRGPLQTRRTARTPNRAQPQKAQAAHRRGEGGPTLLPPHAAPLSRRQCADPPPASPAAAPVG